VSRAVRTALAFGAVGVLAALLLSSLAERGAGAAASVRERPAPPLAGRTLQDGHADLADLRGSVVLVNVWASWCGPCRDELPLLTEAQGQLGGRGLQVLGLNMNDGPVAARALLTQTGATSLTSVQDPDGTIAIDWGVRGVPETFLVDRGGVIRSRHFGPLTEQWLRDVVVPYLGRA
jgi:cytochrome c biogenesis protein CcmG/thiol:disulfide interchange protein DsbE